MPQWPGDGMTDLWTYPSSCANMSSTNEPSCKYVGGRKFNPQGFTFTYAGSGVAGMKDGIKSSAQFNGPRDVAIDNLGNIVVADTLNNAIRLIDINRKVF